MTAEKPALRREALVRRDGIPPDIRAAAGEAVAAHVLTLADRLGPGPVAGFVAVRSELDPLPAMRILSRGGLSLALPRVAGDALFFHAWSPGDPLAAGAFGLSEPLPDAPVVRPSALLVPLAAFDRRGHRIGYGKGFYDRAVAALRATGPLVTVGIAFAVQEIPAVPEETHDHALDWIVTEREVIRTATD
jgi:5-formyltetrahydrofolate cyclo-ligase